ncbi:peptidoglycan recognition protein family protein [Streptomonospora salina]|uniref:N-acetylmuramoyl-L-alanine amidase domain-containing protein n=1 Tax=Streptomonospora salina TaxID=104205 RepID=A0A841EB46_9ACTN|nr:peptidoglycan recognition family protein [Streptomonospora salina]MBB6000206.1 hypothetical protein [Streptomonospora salina]
MSRPTRLVWRSELGWGPSPADGADPKQGLVVHYDSYDQGLADKDHAACLDYWNGCRDYHVNGNGWVDVGYSWFCCAHGFVIEGRGLFKQQAAQRGANDSHYSVTLATGPNDELTAAQINAVRELRQWLMEPESSIAGAVFGHRDFNSTDCPGDAAYAFVRDGVFSQPPGTIDKEDDVPTYISVGKTRDSRQEELRSHEWQQIYFDKNNSGGCEGHHADGDYPSLVTGPTYFQGEVSLRIEGLPKGAEGQIRAVEVTKRDGEYAESERYFPQEYEGTNGNAYPKATFCGFVGKGHKLRLEVVHFGGEDVRPRVTGGQARIQAWEL